MLSPFEMTHYSIFSDLESAFLCLRDEIFRLPTSEEKLSLLLYWEEATNWESVRDLSHMQSVIGLMKAIPFVGSEVKSWLLAIESILWMIVQSGETLPLG